MTPAMPHFDFAAYLSSLHAGTYSVEALDGGRVNDTVRVHAEDIPECPGSSEQGPWWTLHSFVAKHAPPVLRYPRPGVPFSPLRLTMEARALALFAGGASADALLPPSALRLLREHPQIVVPKPLHYCAERHVLLESDLVDLTPLPDWLFARELPAEPVSACAGEDLGRFLGALHAATWNLPPDVSAKLRDHFANPDVDQVLFEITVKPLRDTLQTCGVPDAESLGALLNATWKGFDTNKPHLPGDQLVFCHGDMWHTNVFLMPQVERGPKIAVIDWEFACVGRIGLDVARFTAYLYLFSQSPRLGGGAKAALHVFTAGLVRGFIAVFPQLRLPFARNSFAVLYGLHICNGAFWHTWCDCGAADSDPCAHTRTLVHYGAAWIRYGLHLTQRLETLLPQGDPLCILFDWEQALGRAEVPRVESRCFSWSRLPLR